MSEDTSNDKLDLRREYFTTLRQEILEVKARLVRLLLVGIIGAPVLSYFALTDPSDVKVVLLVAPLLSLLLLVMYFSEQTSMMRAGKFLHDQLESGDDWEHWMGELRAKAAEPPLFGLFVVITIGYFLVMSSFAFQSIMDLDPNKFGVFIYSMCKFTVPVVYGVSVLWVLITLVRFWHAAFRTD